MTQWNWGDEPFTDCQTFAMEVMVTSVYAPQECPQTITTTSITRRDDDDDDDDDQWPPEYPEEIEEDYEYTSAGADLWYRQTAEDQVGHQYRFRLEHTSDFAAQVRYDFPTGQLSLVLQRLVEDEDDDDDDNNNNRKDATTTMITATTIAESHYSEHGRGRSVLRALGIPAGEYVLVMYEPSPVPSETAGCSHIEFTTIVRRKRAAYLTEDMTLPPSLDTIPYLGFDHSMHVQDTYVLFRGNGSSSSSSDITTEATTFTLWEPSTVHVHAVLQAEYARGKLLNLTIVYVSGAEGSEYVVAEGTTELHTALETPGVYRLEVSKGTDVLEMEGGGVLADMEVSVQPVAKLREVVAAAPQDPNCVDTLVPPVTLSPEGYYFYDGDDAALAISYATLVKSSSSSGHVVQRLKLEVRVPSRVYAQVGYEFGLGHLELAITQADAVGSQQRNVNTLRATLRQPGTYYLDIRSPAGPPALQPPQEPLEYCFPFTFVLSVVPATKGGSGGGCVYKDPVPWDLNRYDGGSARFGGPIDDATGALLLYGDSFAVPAGTASSEMAVAVAEDSALSILLTAGTGLKSVRAQLYECSSDENENGECANRMLVAPLGSAELTGGAQQLTTFALSGGGGGKEGITATATTNNNNKKYYVVLKYGEVDGDCGEFGMQVEVKRVEALRAALVCDEGFVPADPPAQTLVPDEHGFARDIRSSAFYADKPLATSTAPYEIGLALNVTSKVVATLSFSPLTDLYGLNLMALYSGGSSVRARAALRSQQQMTSDLATVTLALADTVGIVPSSETHYGLRITQDNWTSPVATGGQTGKDKQLCLPYIYTAYAIPQNGLPYVSEVTPAGARDLVPGDSITLYVTFSSPVYTAGERALMPATEEVMKKTFYLYDRLSGSTASHIFPESCVCIGTSSSVSNTARWGITFSSSELAPLVDYQLGLADNNTLVDASGEEVRYVFVNVYHTIDTSCNGHGTLTGTTTPTCVCDKGYAGQTCQACDAGYVNVGTGTKGKALRCIPAMTCEEDTCGCDYNDDDNNDNNNSNNNDGGNNYQYTCIPLGECDVNASSGLAHCVCKEGYDGPYCRVCADGWDGWPRCIPCFNGATWDTENERCICAGNFAGPKCQQCRFGYSGKDCATYGGAIFGVFLGLAVIAVVVVVVVVLVRRRSAAAKTPYRTYQRVITSIGSGNGYDDELDEEDDGEDWSSVPSAAREARKPQVFTLRKAECELFADDGLQNPDEDEDVKKEESSSDAGSKGKGKGKDKDNEDELDFFAQK